MQRLVHHFVTMAFNNAWGNHRLLKTVCALTHEELVASRTSFFPSIKATLNHNLTVDWFYVDALERAVRGEPPNEEARRFFEPEEPFDRAEPLREAQLAVDRRLISFVQGLDDEKLDMRVGVFWSSGLAYEAAHRVLAHLLQHQIHHRGQAHAMLAGTRLKPPQLDEFFCANDAKFRAEDFAELGFSEEEIWNA